MANNNDNRSPFSTFTDIQALFNTLNRNMGALIQAVTGLNTSVLATFPRVTGTFTLAAAATTTVAETRVAANSIISWYPTNASAATLQGSNKSLYTSAIVPGVSFTVATASGAAAAGGEQFSYAIVTPS